MKVPLTLLSADLNPKPIFIDDDLSMHYIFHAWFQNDEKVKN